MKILGRHIIAEFYHVESELLNDKDFLEKIFLEGTRLSKATIINSFFHKFSPVGVSGVIVIAESHVTVHTYPEYNYAAVDVFTCGENIDPYIIFNYIQEKFNIKEVFSFELLRGKIKN